MVAGHSSERQNGTPLRKIEVKACLSSVFREESAMVFEGVLVDVLNHFLRPYLKNLDASQLRCQPSMVLGRIR